MTKWIAVMTWDFLWWLVCWLGARTFTKENAGKTREWVRKRWIAMAERASKTKPPLDDQACAFVFYFLGFDKDPGNIAGHLLRPLKD